MGSDRAILSRMLAVGGSFLLVLGILLLLVKLLVALAWYASGAIAIAGLVLLAAGWLIGGARGY